MKLIDANHVPGSCMFVFWIYRINNHSILGAPKLFIYTGDYRLNDTIENKLMEYRHKERCYDTTIVNDNNREDDIDNALPTPAKAIERMKEFIFSLTNNDASVISAKVCNPTILINIANTNSL